MMQLRYNLLFPLKISWRFLINLKPKEDYYKSVTGFEEKILETLSVKN
jgi:hypothetical protein